MKQLRVAILGDYDNYLSYFTYGALEGAIRAGMWVRPVPLFGHDLSVIEDQIRWFKPHILLCHCIFNRRPHNRENVIAMLRRIKNSGVVIFYHLGDARTNPRYPYDISDFVSAALVNSNMLDHLSNIWKVPCYKWPYACLYQKEIVDKDDRFSCAVAFTGSLSNDNSSVHYPRTVFINKLSKTLQVKIFPTPETGNTRFQTAELSASADMVLGCQMTDIDGYLDVRPYQYIGSGALYLHDKCPQMDEVFVDDNHYVNEGEYLAYNKDDPKFIKGLYKMYIIDYPKMGKAVREKGFKYCQSKHSTKQRMEKVKEIYAKESL